MKRITRLVRFSLFFVWLGGMYSSWASDQEVVAVLSSGSAPYMEALEGIKEVIGIPIKVVNLTKSERWPEQASLIIAIGGKAALQNYPSNTPLIYCVAPAVFINKTTHAGPLSRVYVSPSSRVLFERLKEMQPKMKRLATLWMNRETDGYFDAFTKEGIEQGITVIPMHVNTTEELLGKLRSLKGAADALWLPPDPELINPQNFASIKEFSLSNNLPLYVAMESLAGVGASAAVSISFREMGRKAGTLAALSLAGSVPDSEVYGDKAIVTINASIATQSGLSIPASILKKADRVIP